MTAWILSSSVLILVIAALRYTLKGKISMRLQYALWGLVLLRLLVPVNFFESPISIMNAFQPAAQVLEEQPAMPTYAPVLGNAEGTLPSGATASANANSVTSARHHALLHGESWLITGWLAGVCIIGLTLLLSNLSFGRKLRKTRIKYPADGCRLPVYEVNALPTPCLFGLFHPSVYLTPEVAGDEMKLRHVLTHELTHWHHGDPVWSALRGVCLVLHWYNPLVWLAAALSRRDAELACDEGTIRRLGEESRVEYGQTLIGLTCAKRGNLDLLNTAITMTDGKKGIKERITRIAKKPKAFAPALIAALLAAAVATGCTFTGAKTAGNEILPLTSEELEQYNEAFAPMRSDEAGNAEGNPLGNFLTSYYDKPENIDLAEFLRYFSPSEDVTDEAEFKALKTSENWPFGDVALDDMPVPIHRYSADTVSKALKQYTGITLKDLSGVGADELIYLKGYNAYYNFTSDAGGASFTCTSGESQGDIVRLYSKNATLKLKLHGGGFWIVSHQQTGGKPGESGLIQARSP